MKINTRKCHLNLNYSELKPYCVKLQLEFKNHILRGNISFIELLVNVMLFQTALICTYTCTKKVFLKCLLIKIFSGEGGGMLLTPFLNQHVLFFFLTRRHLLAKYLNYVWLHIISVGTWYMGCSQVWMKKKCKISVKIKVMRC